MKYIAMRHTEKKYQDDVRVVDRVTFASLDYNLLSNYIQLLKQGKSRLAAISDEGCPYYEGII